MYGCPGCGNMMTFDIPGQELKCAFCGRTESIEEADRREARKAGNSFAVDLLTCPTCGAEIRAMNTAQAAFCSYCGASVMLESKTEDMDPPETVVPFRVTREECFEKYRSMVKKSLCADRKLKKDMSAESFRGIYVPHYIYTASIQGETNLEGRETKGNDTYYYSMRVGLDHQFMNILHDGSKEMPDTLSEKIDRVEPDSFRAFSPAYLSGFYADIPDTKEDEYIPYAKAEAVRAGLPDVMDDLSGRIKYSRSETEKKLVELADAKCTGRTLLPVWFMSVRNKGRLLYAIQNGVTGEMTADIPMDIPRFAIIAGILAIPLFLLFNAFLTLRPEMVMIAAMLLAVGAQIFVNVRQNKIAEKEQAATGEDGKLNTAQRLKMLKRLAKYAKGSSAVLWETIGGFLGLGAAFFLMSQFSKVNEPMVFKAGALGLTVLMGVLVILSTHGKAKAPAGSFAALIVMALGSANLILDPFHSDDLVNYLLALLCLASVIWICVDLLLLYNRGCSNPLPQFETHQGGEGNA